MFEFFSALFSQRNTIKEDKQTNKEFVKRKREVLSILKDLDDIDLNFASRARLDIEKLDKILKDNEAIIELSFGNLLEEALTTLDLIENKAIELRPLADLRVYKNVYTGEITKPTKEEIEKAKEVLENPDFVMKGPFYDDFYDKDSDIYKSVQRGERLI